MAILLKYGVALLLAILFGDIFKRLKLPSLIGYIVGGFILGPSVLNFLNESFLVTSSPAKLLSLAFIMFIIGTKIKFERIGRVGKGVLIPSFLQAGFAFLLVFLGTLPFLSPLYALLVASISAATAPAATALVIEEYHSEGPVTDTVFLTVALDNSIVLFLFYFLLGLLGETGFLKGFENLLFKFITSLLVGTFGGLLLSYIETKIEDSGILFTIFLSLFFSFWGLAEKMGLFTFLMALFMGISYTNSTIKEMKGYRTLDILHLPIYALFFTLAGASLHIDTLYKMRYAAVVYIIARSAGKYAGAYLGSKLGNLGYHMERFLGLGILTHAGLATGLAVFLGEVGGKEGKMAMNVILASTVIFEIGGPLVLKEALLRVGEVRIIHILRRGFEPILDFEFHSIIHELMSSLGLRKYFMKKTPEEIKVEHILRRHFPHVYLEDHLDEVIKKFEKTYCNSILVMDHEKNYKGIIILRELEELFLDEFTKMLIVAQDALKYVEPLKREASILEAFHRMREERIDCLPVVDNEGKVIGVVLRRDILFALR